MFVEAIVLTLVVTALLIGVYWTATVAKRLIVCRDKNSEQASGPLRARQRRLADVLNRPRDIILTADLFKSLSYLLTVLLVVWWVPRWSIQLPWSWLPTLIVALVIIWILRVIVGEMMPRVHLIDDSLDDAPRGAMLFAALMSIMHPVLVVVRRIGGGRSSQVSAEEREEIFERTLETMTRSVGNGGPIIEDDEREMIQGVIGLENTEVREVMVPRIHIIALESRSDLKDVRRIVREHGHSRLPIYEDDLDTIIGILYVKDLITIEDGSGSIDLANMARDAFVVPETKRVDALLEEFKRRKTHLAIVVDEFGGTAGLVTLEDVLEEIVGEIHDEHDIEDAPIEHISNDTILAGGVVPLNEIGDALDVELPDDKFETIGGLIYDRFGGIPTPGYQIEEYGLVINVERMDGQRIEQVRIKRVAATDSPTRS